MRAERGDGDSTKDFFLNYHEKVGMFSKFVFESQGGIF